jgi:hypothetical protein
MEMPLFTVKKEISQKSEWRERMEEVRLDDLSPREAWKLLEKWKSESTGDDASDRLFNASRDSAEC